MSNFVHLHTHSHYSLLDGLSKLPELVAKTKELGMNAVALTDHGVMYGALEFYKTCVKNDIKPIVGMETYIAPRKYTDKKHGVDNKSNHLVLLAANETGYKNLIKLTTAAHLDGFYYKPRIDNELLKKHFEGIIALSACLQGKIPKLLLDNKFEEARETAFFYEKLFGKGNFYLEIEHHPEISRQIEINDLLIKLSRDTGVPLVLTKDSHYLDPRDNLAQDAMVCIQTGKTLDDPNRMDISSINVSLLPPEEMIRYATELGIPEAAENTVKIAEKCNLKLDLLTWHFPKFDLPEGENSEDRLIKDAYEGLKKREGQVTPEDKKRLDYELDIINSKKYTDYFLIVADFMNWARSQNIIATTRGSASGSLVSYAIGITSVNPLRFQLPFERFLTKERPTPPDIDCDIQDSKRDEVIQYVKNKYGENRVASIGTFGTMQARAAVRDITRVMGLPYSFGDKLAKMIPQGPQGAHITIDKAKKINPEFKEAYDKDPRAKSVLDLAERIEGCVRHVSVHAAGVVIAPEDLTEFVPLQREPKGEEIITQYDMRSIDPNVEKKTVGLLKADFLGIRNLSILGLVIKIVERTKKIKIDLDKLPWDDKKTFELLASGRTMGVFQLSSSGMTANLINLKPDNIYDIMAMVALYRPGPMEIIPEYIKRKHDPSSVTYPDPRLKKILERTFGLLIYQDDVMMTAMTLAGYTPEEADKFRKAMGKKIKELMAEQKEKFITGCVKNGLTNRKAREIWGYIEPFAGYGFNKAHSASYAVVAYQTAYMKANYPSEFMAALMTAESGNTNKIADAVVECNQMGIEVLPPNINESLANFTYISDTAVRFGLSAIKNLGENIIKIIIEERKKNGPYQNLGDLLSRVYSRNLNKKSLEALIKSGAMDDFGERGQMLNNMNKLLNFIKMGERERNTGQSSLFSDGAKDGIPDLILNPSEPAEEKECLMWEKEYLGLYVTSHPFKQLAEHLKSSTAQIRDVTEGIYQNNSKVSLAGIITNVHKLFTKKNELMMFVRIEDLSGAMEIIFFPKTIGNHSTMIVEDKFILATGRISNKDDENKLIVDSFNEIDPDNPLGILNELKDNPKKFAGNGERKKLDIIITIDAKKFNTKLHNDLKTIFTNHHGRNRVFLTINQNGNSRKIATNFYINWSEDIKQKIESLTGPDTSLSRLTE